ncbi:hypothetical protein D3C71_1311510 [compost metagenome]
MHRHHFAIQDAAFELRDLIGNLTERVDQAGHAVVGGADHPAAGLQRTHLRHLQVLQRADGGAEPGVVADGQQQVAAGGKAGGELRINHFIADERRDLITLGLQQRLVSRAASEVRHWQVEEGDQPAQDVLQGNIFTKGHQFLLEVSAVAFTGHGDAIEETLLVAYLHADRDTGNQRRFTFGREAAHHVQVALGGLLEHRDRRFRPDEKVDSPGAETHVAIQRQLRVELRRVPLHALFDVALNGGDAQWRA